jgi:sugar phosphate isomerase/epimerase
MLQKLGIAKFAYDWREEHVASFDSEMIAVKNHHITLQAFWMPYGPDPFEDKHYSEIFALLKRHDIKTQLWWSYGSNDSALQKLTQKEKVKAIGRTVRRLAEDAAAIGCTVGLYNHGGWFGEPENELSILDYVNLPNLGIVYNFNHAEEQIDSFPSFFPRILPHLIALNIAGLQNGKPGKVVPVGQGDSEQKMIKRIGLSSYSGTIGIINENTTPDAEAGLTTNMAGLQKILTTVGFESAAQTFK